MLVHDGYLYNREGADGKKAHWKCVEYHKSRCKGRCITVDAALYKMSGRHNHEPDPAQVARKQQEERVRERFAALTALTRPS